MFVGSGKPGFSSLFAWVAYSGKACYSDGSLCFGMFFPITIPGMAW